jgi:hypothetical protein
LNAPSGVAVDTAGDLYIADTYNNRVRQVTSGTIATVAGDGTGGLSGDGGSATGATLQAPGSIAVDTAGIVVVADSNNNAARLLTPPGTQAVLSIQSAHSGAFTQGQTGATYALTVTNGVGAGTTAGTVTVTEVLPAGLTLTSMAGTGWTCTSPTCTRTDALIGGSSYPAIAVTVTVSAAAPGQLTNLASVSGGGAVAAGRAPGFTVVAAAGAGQEGQTISFGTLSNQPYGTPPFKVSASASSGLPVGFNSLTTSVCTVSSATVTLVSVGTCTIQATQAGNTSYAAATPVNQSFQVTQAAQTITFGALSNQPYGTAPFTVSATASSGLAVSFASTTSAVCTVSGSTVTLVSVGTCTIQATQPGNTNYAAATPGSQSFTVVAETTLTPATLAFGNQAINETSSSKTATFKNTEAVALTITSITVGGANPADFVPGGNCPISPSTLGTGKSCSITVTFTPSILGSETATLTVTNSAPTSPQAVALTGTGVAPVTLAPSTTLGLGTVAVGETSAAKTVTLTNHENIQLDFSGIQPSTGFAVASNTCGASIAAGATCTVGVTFSPTTTGAATGTLTFTDDAANSPQAVALTGTGK